MMRCWMLLLILLIFHPFAFSQNQPSAPIDIIFDIDWTTFYTVEPGQNDHKTIAFEDKLYRPTDHLESVIERLIQRYPQIRITFFSGGQKQRNEFLLKKVHLRDGRSLYDIAFRVFSFENLTELSPNETLPFTSRFKKNVSSLIPYWNPQRTILIDDQTAFAVPPLTAVESMGIYNFQLQFDFKKTTERFAPPTEAAWQTERNKALLWLKHIEIAISNSNRTGRSFSQVAKELWISPFAPNCAQIFNF